MKTLRRLGVLLLALFAAWLLLALTDGLPRIPAAQREALARLRAEPPPLPGRNATIHVWLLDRDVAEDEWPRWLALAGAEAQAGLARLPAAPSSPAAFLACVGTGDSCLARVTAALDAARAWRAAQAPRLRRIDWLQREPAHLVSVGARDFDTPFPPLGGLHAAVRLDATLRFLDGDRQGALVQLCHHVKWWRALRRDTDLVTASSVGAAVVSGAAQSYFELLRALPADETPPADCRDAFAPLADAELDLCRVMRGEFFRVTGSLQQGFERTDDAGPLRQLARRVAFRAEPSAALLAPSFDYWCSEDQRRRAASRAEARMTAPGQCHADGWLFNFFGCTLAPITAPTLPGWYQRVLDLDGKLRLVRSAEWLLAQRAEDPVAAFAQRPAELRDRRQALEGSRCRPMLRYLPRGGTPWHLSLAPPPDCAPLVSH